MNKDKKEVKKNKFQFNTYCIFTKEKGSLKERVGLIFKDYIESIKIK